MKAIKLISCSEEAANKAKILMNNKKNNPRILKIGDAIFRFFGLFFGLSFNRRIRKKLSC